MARTVEYPWAEIKHKYQTGAYTMSELADEYGFSPTTGYKKSSAEEWNKGETGSHLQNQLEEKILDNEAQKRKDTRIEYYVIFSHLRDRIANEVLNGDPDKSKIRAYETAVKALKGCKDAEWDILMLDQNLKNWSAKYRIEKKEVLELIKEDDNARDVLKKLYRKSRGEDKPIDITPEEMEEKDEEED